MFRPNKDVASWVINDLSADDDTAIVDCLESSEYTKSCGLARAVGSQESKNLAWVGAKFDIEIQMAQSESDTRVKNYVGVESLVHDNDFRFRTLSRRSERSRSASAMTARLMANNTRLSPMAKLVSLWSAI